MLSIAVAGAVFASPPPSSILMALRHVTKTDSGELLIILNKPYNYAYPLAAKFILNQRMISICQGARVNILIIVLKLDV